MKKWAVCAFGLVVLAGVSVSAAAVDPYAPRCGYGYKSCSGGYKCVEASTCKNTNRIFHFNSTPRTVH